MSESDFKAKNALTNFSNAVSSAHATLVQEQQRLAEMKMVTASKQEKLNTTERQRGEAQEKLADLEAQRARFLQQRELRKAENDDQTQQVAALQEHRMQLDAAAAEYEVEAQRVQSDYTTNALELQQKLLNKLRENDPEQLERRVERKKAELKGSYLRIARIEASLAKLQSAPTAAVNPNNNNNNSTISGISGFSSNLVTVTAGGGEEEENQKRESTLRHLAAQVESLKAERIAVEHDKKTTLSRLQQEKQQLRQAEEEAAILDDQKTTRLAALEDSYDMQSHAAECTPCGSCGEPLLPVGLDNNTGSQPVMAH